MRYLYAILGLLILIAALGGIKGAQISSLIQMGKAMEAAGVVMAASPAELGSTLQEAVRRGAPKRN